MTGDEDMSGGGCSQKDAEKPIAYSSANGSTFAFLALKFTELLLTCPPKP